MIEIILIKLLTVENSKKYLFLMKIPEKKYATHKLNRIKKL
jgi:hypothetical protein